MYNLGTLSIPYKCREHRKAYSLWHIHSVLYTKRKQMQAFVSNSMNRFCFPFKTSLVSFHQITPKLRAGMVCSNVLISLSIFLPWLLNNSSLTVLDIIGISSRFPKFFETYSRSSCCLAGIRMQLTSFASDWHTYHPLHYLKHLFLWIWLSQAGLLFFFFPWFCESGL